MDLAPSVGSLEEEAVGADTPTAEAMAPTDAHLIHSHYTHLGWAAQDPIVLLTRLLNGDPVDREALEAACPGLHLSADSQQHPAAVKAYLTARPDLLEAMLRTDPTNPQPTAPVIALATSGRAAPREEPLPKFWSAAELLTIEFPPLVWIVEGILPLSNSRR